MKLTKRIPARTETVGFKWCKKDFMVMSQKWRTARGEMSDPLDKCWWCKHPFVNGEMIALAQTKGTVNKVLCQTCAEELLSSATGEEE